MAERHYLVVIDGNSSIGRIYAVAKEVCFIKSGVEGLQHPALVCNAVRADIPGYTSVEPIALQTGALRPVVHLPQHTVVMIHEFPADGLPPKIGF